MPAPDLHIVYGARLHADGRIERVRLSRPMEWGAALSRWQRLTPDARTRPHGMKFLAVRSADDPGWPAKGARRPPQDLLTGRFI